MLLQALLNQKLGFMRAFLIRIAYLHNASSSLIIKEVCVKLKLIGYRTRVLNLCKYFDKSSDIEKKVSY